MTKLVIVESPAKAKTIKKYLGKGYEITASMGHVRDLPEKRLGVNVDNNYEPLYMPIRGKSELIKNLKKSASESEAVYLATDPDREGEAISWHLASILGIDNKDKVRVTFNEITETAVKEGIEHPRSIDEDLVNSQQARRIIDRLVGYKLSPFLWKKVKKGLSAGRVQSVATRLVVDREKEIENFKPSEYWNLSAQLSKDGKKFTAKFYGTGGKKTDIKNKESCDAILEGLKNAEYTVSDVKRSNKQRQTPPPFITSTLQQEASRRFGLSARSTMRIAQQLYEGINIKGRGLQGLITYMRTDSLRISKEAADAAKGYIISKFGEKYYPKSPKIYKTKAGAQDAHEAIRPSDCTLSPDMIADDLTKDQLRIYRIIWERFLASQMANAVYESVNADIKAGEYLFKAVDQIPVFSGFTVIYEEASDEENDEKKDSLPDLNKGDILKLVKIIPEQKFTLPPSRYTEASLIKALEENGIGRPSTYAPTISTIMERNYVEKEGKLLKPTVLGNVTTELMKEHFSAIVDVDYTATMEKSLDEVENGKNDYLKVIDDFYKPFAVSLSSAESKMSGQYVKIPDEETDVICEKCGRKMVIKQSRYGKFLACPGYPECRNTKSITIETDGICPKCGKKILQKKSKAGKKYFGCEDNPKCDFMTWDTPIKDKCPKCGKTLFRKPYRGGKVYCAAEGCGYEKESK